MWSVDENCLIEMLRRVPQGRLGVCRAVCREWRAVAEALISETTPAFLACCPGMAGLSPTLTVRTTGRPRLSVAFERGKENVRAVSGACLMLEYQGVRPGIEALRGRSPASLVCESRVTRAALPCLVKMAPSLRLLDLRGLSTDTASSRFRAQLCGAISMMTRLEELHVPGHDLDERSARSIARCKGLRVLNVAHNCLGPAGCAELARLRGLRELDLSDNEAAEGARHLSALTGLTDLSLNFNGIEDAPLAACLAPLALLRRLRVTWNEVGPLATRAVAGGLRLLTSVDVSFCEPSACLAARGLPSLTSLTANHTGASEAEARGLAAPLLALQLSNNLLTDAAARGLVAGAGAGLTSLDVGWNCLGHEAAACIAEGATRLARLDIRNNEVLDVGALALMGSRSLRWLNVSHNGVSATCVQHIRSEARGRGAFTLFA